MLLYFFMGAIYAAGTCDVMGCPDNMKLQSSMTLFYIATGDELFKKVLDKFYGGKTDDKTVSFLQVFG